MARPGTRLPGKVRSGDRRRRALLQRLGTQGLTWYTSPEIRGNEVWGHGGSDPGINTDIRLVPDEGIAAIVFINTWGGNPSQMTRRLLEEAPGL